MFVFDMAISDSAYRTRNCIINRQNDGFGRVRQKEKMEKRKQNTRWLYADLLSFKREMRKCPGENGQGDGEMFPLGKKYSRFAVVPEMLFSHIPMRKSCVAAAAGRTQNDQFFKNGAMSTEALFSSRTPAPSTASKARIFSNRQSFMAPAMRMTVAARLYTLRIVMLKVSSAVA